MNDDLAVLVQRADSLLEVAFADAEHTADQGRIALVADRQGTVVVAQLGEDLRVQAGGGFFADRLQAQADLAVGTDFFDKALLFFTGAHQLGDFVLVTQAPVLVVDNCLEAMSVASATSKSTSWPGV